MRGRCLPIETIKERKKSLITHAFPGVNRVIIHFTFSVTDALRGGWMGTGENALGLL